MKHIVLVLSGKGGVGKSSISVQLALTLLALSPAPARIGLLDIDLTGPSIPRMLGLDGASVHQSDDGWVPVYLPIGNRASTSNPNGGNEINSQERKDELKVMSIGFLLKDSKQAVIWRGPKKSAMIKQFLGDVRWGDLDWLVIDTPPGKLVIQCAPTQIQNIKLIMQILIGTSDEHISLLENLLPTLQGSATTLHSILVTTPQAVSLSDVAKELSFTRRTGLPVLGLIENMSGYICPHCSVIHKIFGQGGGEEFCRIESEKVVKEGKPDSEKLLFLGRLPVDSEFIKVVDGPESGYGLLERYQKTKSARLLEAICRKVVDLIEHPQVLGQA